MLMHLFIIFLKLIKYSTEEQQKYNNRITLTDYDDGGGDV